MLIDVHAHLYDEKFNKDRDKIIKSFKGIIVNNGEEPKTNRLVLDLAKKYSNCKAALGIHPEFSHKLTDLELKKEIAFIKKSKPIAIGEVGLDNFWIKEKKEGSRERQVEVFKKMLKLAKELNIPAIIHSRWAKKDVLDIIEELGCKKIILHGWGNASESETERALNTECYICISCAIFRDESLIRDIKSVPLNRIFTETDSPLMAIEKGSRNEPSNIKKIIEEIARLRKISSKEVEERIRKNVSELFGLEIFNVSS